MIKRTIFVGIAILLTVGPIAIKTMGSKSDLPWWKAVAFSSFGLLILMLVMDRSTPIKWGGKRRW
jgi:hypothetical protein